MDLNYNGKEYKSVRDCCYKNGKGSRKEYNRVMKRISRGSSLQEAMSDEIGKGKTCKDHMDIEYKSMQEMVDTYGVDRTLYEYRVNAGWDKEKALLGEVITDHKGNEFSSVKEKCEHYGVKANTYYARKKRGWGEEEALTGKRKQ